MKIVVTGAAGFVGTHLLNALESGHTTDIEIIPTAQTAFTRADGHVVRALEITQRVAINAFVQEVRPTHIVHLAGVPSIAATRADPVRAWEVNLMGTLDLARAVLEHAPDCALIFAGSSESYGASAMSGEPLTESHRLQPLNEYAATKSAADLALGALAASGLKAIRFRPFNHTGPGQTPDFVVPAFASQIARIEKGIQSPAIHVGNLDVKRDFLDVRDVVDGYIAAIKASDDLARGTVINLASGNARTIRDILESLLRLSTTKIEVRPDPHRQRSNDIPSIVGDATLARKLLGWWPNRPFDKTLLDVLDYFREQTKGSNS